MRNAMASSARFCRWQRRSSTISMRTSRLRRRMFSTMVELRDCLRPHTVRRLGLAPDAGPDAAAQELCRCVRDHGFVGGHIASNVRGVYLHDDMFEPIFRTAVDLNVPLFVHPADPLGKERTGRCTLSIVAGYLFDSTINILKMICSGFLDRWPGLKLVCAHGGAFSPILRARMQREVDTNQQLLCPHPQKTRRRLFRKAVFRPLICSEPAISALCDRGGPDRASHAWQRRAVPARRA